jgi:hypothetical protein
MEALNDRGDQLSSYWIIQQGIEKLINGDELEDIHKNLLLELGVIENTEEEVTPIVKPHKFNGNG